jgi:hypothetical protein
MALKPEERAQHSAEFDAHPAMIAPGHAALAPRAVFLEHQVKGVWNSVWAFDDKPCASFRKIHDDAIDGRSKRAVGNVAALESFSPGRATAIARMMLHAVFQYCLRDLSITKVQIADEGDPCLFPIGDHQIFRNWGAPGASHLGTAAAVC